MGSIWEVNGNQTGSKREVFGKYLGSKWEVKELNKKRNANYSGNRYN
jgi:hypothetical protein